MGTTELRGAVFKVWQRGHWVQKVSEKRRIFFSSFVFMAQRGLNEARKSELPDESQNHS